MAKFFLTTSILVFIVCSDKCLAQLTARQEAIARPPKAPIPPFDRCSYRIPPANCLTYIGEFVVYDANQGKCVIQDAGCNILHVLPYVFDNFVQCRTECGENGNTVATTPWPITLPRVVVRKCGYRVPEVDCGIFIGNMVVFDSNIGKCTVQSMGCRASDLAPYAFATIEDCEAMCLPIGARTTISNPSIGPVTHEEYHEGRIITPPPPELRGGSRSVAATLGPASDIRCSYRIPVRTCEQFIGTYIVYDSRRDRCTYQNNGCEPAFVEEYSFRTLTECKLACRPKPIPLAVRKCVYKVPPVTCGMPIGPVIVYDSMSEMCVSQSRGCSLTDVLPYAFDSFYDCQQTCQATNENFINRK